MAFPKLSEEIDALLIYPEFHDFLKSNGYIHDVLFLKRVLDYANYYTTISAQFPTHLISPTSPVQTSLPLTKTTTFRVFSQLHSYAKEILVQYCLPSQDLNSTLPPKLSLLQPRSFWVTLLQSSMLTRPYTLELKLHSAIFKLTEQLTQPWSIDPFQSFHPSIFIPSFQLVENYVLTHVLSEFDLSLTRNLSSHLALVYIFMGCISVGLSFLWIFVVTHPRIFFSVYFKGYTYLGPILFFMLLYQAMFFFLQVHFRFSLFNRMPMPLKEYLQQRVMSYKKKIVFRQISLAFTLSLLITFCLFVFI